MVLIDSADLIEGSLVQRGEGFCSRFFHFVRFLLNFAASTIIAGSTAL
jgi:hypothetical protein